MPPLERGRTRKTRGLRIKRDGAAGLQTSSQHFEPMLLDHGQQL